jgi:hypothetical protein
LCAASIFGSSEVEPEIARKIRFKHLGILLWYWQKAY